MNNKIENIRHTLTHLLAAAIQELYPDAKIAIGPTIENGFYYDFDNLDIGENDLARIEATMRKILPSWKNMKQEKSYSPKNAGEAKKRFKDNKYKKELIDDLTKEGQKLTFYKAGNFSDLCRGGHVASPAKDIDPKTFKLTNVAGAYWRGNEKNTMLTRIYGVAFETKKELDEYLKREEEAKKRDHKRLGRELDLFVFSDIVGKGLPLWTVKGTTIRRELERFIIDEEIKRGYQHVFTPDIAKLDLYKKSGHYPYFKDSMYAPITIDNEQYMLRPMSCPHHYELYLSRPHSYRELPIRMAEMAKLYRYEQSGELSGLMRVRAFTLADAHIICANEEQAKKEIAGALDLIEYVAKTFKLKISKNYWYRLSLREKGDNKKYYKNDKAWNASERILKEVLKERKAEYIEIKGEAAFYGPKIDIQMRNVNGKEDTAFTVQYDFVGPERFNLTYTDKDGKEKPVIIIHRSSIGAIERMVAFLIEHFAGAFPLWLSPTQVWVVPVSDKFNKYGQKILEKLKENNVRTELRDEAESLGKKIRNGELQKIPYLLIVGEKEKKAGSVAVRDRTKGDMGVMKVNKFIEKALDEIDKKK